MPLLHALLLQQCREKAGEKLQAAREAFERGDYSEAKIQIDSIKILYPKAFETRREGIGLMQQVELKEQEKTLVYLDSMLQEKQKEVDTIKKNYTFEKDAEYQKSVITCILTSNRKEPAPLLPALSGR